MYAVDTKRITKKKVLHAINRIIITLLYLVAVIVLLIFTPNFVNRTIAGTNLIVNNNNITADLKSPIISRDNNFYMELKDIKNFLDEYIVEEDGYVICTSNTKTARIPIDADEMYINGKKENCEIKAIKEDSKIYVPMVHIINIYNAEYAYNEKNTTITLDTINRKYVEATIAGDQDVKSGTTVISRTITNVKDGEKVSIVQNNDTDKDVTFNGWTKIRTDGGYIGYVPESSVKYRTVIRESAKYNNIKGKVSMLYDYYNPLTSSEGKASTSEGINIVTPSFYNLRSDGTISKNVNEDGKAYVDWAHKHNLEIWANVSNSHLNNIDKMHDILSTFDTRAKLIDDIIKKIQEDNVDGINIDFENMYKDDKDKFSRLIIELAPRIHDLGKNISVETLAPDGSDTWSLCYDRNTIGKAADYIIFHGYDENTGTTGSVAGGDWTELNIKKYLGQEGVPANKVILAMPFYTKLWKEKDGKLVSTETVNMNSVNIPEGVEKKWDDKKKQNYVEYEKDGYTYKMWIEDEESLSYKLDIAVKYELAGVAFWESGREDASIWEKVKQKISPVKQSE